MPLSTPIALTTWLQAPQPPDHAQFGALARDYLAHADRAALRDVMRRQTDHAKLAETLLLHETLLAHAGPDAVRRAYQHYIVNTDAPIPQQAAHDDFDVAGWVAEYAARLGMTLRPAPGAPDELELSVDDPAEGVRCPRWRNEAQRSAAAVLREAGRLVNHRRYGRADVIPADLFAVQPGADRYAPGNALRLADIAQLVYLQQGFVEAQLRQRGYEAVHWIEDRKADTQAALGVAADHAVLAFRGTRGARDILTDLGFLRTPFEAAGAEPAGEVHRGFLGALDSVWRQVLDAVDAAGAHRPLFVCGHSLGAALAVLAALRLERQGRRVAAVYAYGCPRVGDTDFCRAYDAVLKSRTHLHVNHRDLVTRVPPRWVGFDHVAQPFRQFGEDHVLTMGDTGDEPLVAPADGPTAEALMQRASAERAESERYLGMRRLGAPEDPGMALYGTTHGSGRVVDHGIGEYLFKFACSIVDQRLAGPA